MTASPADPFALLGLPRTFRIDKAALQAAYLRKSAALHPDRVTDPLRQAEAATEAAKVNDARAVLADDEQRANALLALLDGPRKEQLNALPEGFLVEMMSVREEMEEALATGDTAGRERLEKWAEARRAAHIQHVSELFERYDSSPSSETLKAIRIELNAWRYIERMLEQLDPAHRPVT
jgi:molecular chaperone HscB